MMKVSLILHSFIIIRNHCFNFLQMKIQISEFPLDREVSRPVILTARLEKLIDLVLYLTGQPLGQQKYFSKHHAMYQSRLNF